MSKELYKDINSAISEIKKNVPIEQISAALKPSLLISAEVSLAPG